MPLNSKRYFQLHDAEIQQLLLCDNSDTEEALVLDEEDLGFLENDVIAVEEQKGDVESDPVEVVIEPPKECNYYQPFLDKTDDHSTNPTQSIPETISFEWKKKKHS